MKDVTFRSDRRSERRRPYRERRRAAREERDAQQQAMWRARSEMRLAWEASDEGRRVIEDTRRMWEIFSGPTEPTYFKSTYSRYSPFAMAE